MPSLSVPDLAALLATDRPGQNARRSEMRESAGERNLAEAVNATQPATLTEATYGRIRNDILLGVFRPGDKLKLESLRQRYDASINTLRETLSRLVSDGLVANEGQRGFMVVPASLADLRDITEMRRLLECHAVRLSIERADLDWESKVVASYHKLSKIEAVIDSDPKRYSAQLETYNREFHGALISACGSRWLLTFYAAMYDQSLRYRMLAFQVRDFPREQSRREHREILDAALARDADRLIPVLSAHITKGVGMYGEELLHSPGAKRRGPKARKKAGIKG
jgi:GntR family carbon starvation induced transcriptional regulator